MRYSAFRLATHANAALNGRPVLWNLLPEFEGNLEWVFLTPGPNGLKLRKEPGAWVTTMRDLGVRRAWFSFGPTTDLRGEGVMTEGGVRSFYLPSGRKVEEDDHFRVTLRGHPVTTGFDPEIDDVAMATERLRRSLPPIIAYAEEFRKGEFSTELKSALSVLEGHEQPPLEVESFFPVGIYPREHVVLLAAASQGDVFGNGGMGWWYDTVLRDNDEFKKVTDFYASALYSSFVSASYLELP